jgi:hypothetical protein
MKGFQFTILISFLLISACSQKPQQSSEVLAEVGNESLTYTAARANIPVNIYEADSLLAFKKYRDDWIRKQLVLQEAERLNFLQRPGIQRELKRMQEEFILQKVQEYIMGELDAETTVSEQEARNYYQQNKDRFTLNERYVRYRHLVAESNRDAENAKVALMRGESWESVAREYSKYPELKIRESERFWPISIAGGEIQMLNRYLTIIGPSEISPTYRTGNEYHFVQLLEERPEGDHPDLDWLIQQINEWLTLEKRKRAFNTYVKNLYLQSQANNEITIYNLPGENGTAASDTVTLNQISNEN